MTAFTKDPNAVLNYDFDWSDWLGTGEVISSIDVAADTGLTVDSSSNTDDTVTVTLSGGTVGESYTVRCRITTNSSPAQTDDRSMTVTIAER